MISVVIPTYTLNEQLEVIAYNCARGYRGEADELVIVEDGGQPSLALIDIADKYIYHKENWGFTRNLNYGWANAEGDFVALVNSDTFITKGSLRDLCALGKVTSPAWGPHAFIATPPNRLKGCFFVAPALVTEEYGMLDESMRTYFSDDDYWNRIADIFQEIPSVEIGHGGGLTIDTLGKDWIADQTEKDKEIYANKVRTEGQGLRTEMT